MDECRSCGGIKSMSEDTAIAGTRNTRRVGFIVEEAASAGGLRQVWKAGHVVLVTHQRGNSGDARLSIIPANTPFPAPRETGRVLAVVLEPSFLICSAASLGAARAEVRDVREVTDPLIVQLVIALRAEVGRNAPFAETLATALAMHLISHYSVNRSEACADGGLGPTRLRTVVDHINANLDRDISLAALAKAAGLSPSHFIRMFQHSTGLSPHQYVLRARVLRAQALLRGTHHGIAEIARMTGFCGQSHFTKHFGRAFGTTPRRYRRKSQMRESSARPEAALLPT
jgi:AraC family transcriptional regulator